MRDNFMSMGQFSSGSSMGQSMAGSLVSVSTGSRNGAGYAVFTVNAEGAESVTVIMNGKSYSAADFVRRGSALVLEIAGLGSGNYSYSVVSGSSMSSGGFSV